MTGNWLQGKSQTTVSPKSTHQKAATTVAQVKLITVDGKSNINTSEGGHTSGSGQTDNTNAYEVNQKVSVASYLPTKGVSW